jgi:lipid II:glycine glycyltransferase (peptidoglycan interpeptide bridge formation enzyme)
VSVEEMPPTDWDARVVAADGGHVLQGTAWAEHRREQGWRPRFLTFADGRSALLLTVTQRPLPGAICYAPRGPISAGDPPERVAERVVALADWARRDGGTLLVADPELDASVEYERLLAAGGFRETEEIQATRHRLILPLPAGTTEDSLMSSFAKSTRQRIRAAEKVGTRVVEDTAGDHLEAFAGLLAATARRKDFWVGDVGAAAVWWRRVMRAGQARFWAATDGERLLGGLLVYVQGGHLATAYSADDATSRERFPGTMHALRWTAIRAALAAGAPRIDLGGVDMPGARRKPEPGEPTYGLLEHKTGFGARWIESAAAHEVVLRPWVHRATAAARSAVRLARLRRGRPSAARRGAGGGR